VSTPPAIDEQPLPTDERGKFDAAIDEASRPSKPCAKRINHENVSRFETSVTWCMLPDHHDGQCSGPLPTILPPNDLGPAASKRRRW
jgi:hypothetical protein